MMTATSDTSLDATSDASPDTTSDAISNATSDAISRANSPPNGHAHSEDDASDAGRWRNERMERTKKEKETSSLFSLSSSFLPPSLFLLPSLLPSLSLPSRTSNWFVRGLSGSALIAAFAVIVRLGPVAIVVLNVGIGAGCYREVINIAHTHYRCFNLPYQRIICWHFLFCSHYYFYGTRLATLLGQLLGDETLLRSLTLYHLTISFTFYCCGLAFFTLTLRREALKQQFLLLMWSHTALLFTVLPAHLAVRNTVQGSLWYLFPVSVIIFNDISAYVFGFCFGRTPLIQLSPKKTWEGFIGGLLTTMVFGAVFARWYLDSWLPVSPTLPELESLTGKRASLELRRLRQPRPVMLQFDHFVCSVVENEDDDNDDDVRRCHRVADFRHANYTVPEPVAALWRAVRGGGGREVVVEIYPFQLHAFIFSLFASLLGPFGGFFASGFKRAFKIKDFGDTIPGHGGLTDRFDCQLMMASFVRAYCLTFISTADPQHLIDETLRLRAEDQLELYRLLGSHLMGEGLLEKG